MTRKGIVLFLALVTGACGTTGTEPALEPSVAIVFGHITGAEGQPVAGAVVSVFGQMNCDESSDAWHAGTATSDAEGYYRTTLTYLHVRSVEACLTLRVTPPAGSGLQETTVEDAKVTFIHQAHTPPIDSVAVDVELTGEG